MSSGTVKPRVMCRLSPNEEAALLHQQREERRKARLLQVREQERSFAKKVRDNVRTKKQEERRAVEQHLQAVMAASQEAELRELEAHYRSRRRQIGQGHREAQHVTQEENRLQEIRLHLKAEQRLQAKQRHNSAMKELTTNQLRELESSQHPLMMRKRALAMEKERAKHIAVHKPHPTQPLIKDLAVDRGHKVQLKEAEGFASTYYNIPSTIVQRVTVHHQGKPSAQEMAEATLKQDESFMRHSSVAQQEQQEKAWLRHKHALAKVKLEREKAEVVTQLKALEREDRVHRQKSLAKMPANMFQHTQRRVELGCEQQRDMEQAFEGLFIKTHGIHNHPSLSQIASASRQEGSPSPSDTSNTTTTQDSSSTTESQHKLADKSTPQQHSQEQPFSHVDSHSLINPSKNRAERAGHGQPPPTSRQQPLAQSGKGDPSALSITMLSSDYSSFQQKESLLKGSCDGSGGAVIVPCGEIEPSEQSFESTVTTASEEGVHTSNRSPPLFRHVAVPPHPTAVRGQISPPRTIGGATAGDPARPPRTTDVLVSDVTESDIQELTSTTSKSMSGTGNELISTTSKSTSSAGNDSYSGSSISSGGGVGEGAPRLPIKGILKRTAEKGTHLVAPSGPTGKGEGKQKLVSMIRAQHQAWSERLATRANLLQSTISQMEEGTAPTALSPTPPLSQPSEAGGTQHSYPTTSTHGHVQKEEPRAMHTHPSLSSRQSVGGALHQYSHPSPPSRMHVQDEGGVSYQYHAPPSHDQIGGVATPHYPPPLLNEGRSMDEPPSQSPDGQSGGGIKNDGTTTIIPKTSASHQDSLSIFTLSTRDSTRSPEPDITDPGCGSTLLSQRSAMSPEPLSITQYHTTVDSVEPTAQPSTLHHPTSQRDPASGVTSLPPPPFTAEYRVAPPKRAELDGLASLERPEPSFPSADVKMHPPNTGANTLSPSLEPVAPYTFHNGGLPSPDVSLAPAMANMLGSGSHYTPAISVPHPLSPSFSPWGAAVPSHPATSLPLPFRTAASPFMLSNNTPHPYSNTAGPSYSHHQEPHLRPAPLQLPQYTPQPLSPPLASFQMPLSGAPVSTAISAIPTPTADLHHPLSSNHLPSWSADSVTVPPNFHQLSFATPQVNAVQHTATGFPTIPASFHDHSLLNTVETSFDVETSEHPYPYTLGHTHQSGEDDHFNHREASPELAATHMLLHPPTPQLCVDPGTTTQRLEANTDVVQTQPSSEQLSIVTLETSHTYSEPPANVLSPSSHSSILEDKETEEHCTLCSSQSESSGADSDSSSCLEEEEDVDNVNYDASLNEGEKGESKLELEGDVKCDFEMHHLPLSPAVNDDSSILEETESSEGESKIKLDGHSEFQHQHHEGPPGSDSSEDSDSSSNSLSNSSHHGQFLPLPEQSPKHVQPEDRDDVHVHVQPSQENGSSDNSQFSALLGCSASPLSLQEAFLKRKEQFILKSKHRLEQLKENAQKRQADSSPLLAHSTPKLMQHRRRACKPLSPSKAHQGGQGRGLMTSGHMTSGSGVGEGSSKAKQRSDEVRRRAVTFSSPLALPQEHTGTFSPPKFLGAVSTKPSSFLSSQKREKIRRKEMKERNLRFYNKLPEVKRQREEEKRKKAYSTNRDKAKEYQEKLRIKVKKQGEKKRANSSQQATKTKTKPKLKKPPFR